MASRVEIVVTSGAARIDPSEAGAPIQSDEFDEIEIAPVAG